MRPLPTPEIKPFERLRVSDGLLINAERWQRAHAYHRDRQNVHYQSLNQAGVVWGLGVRLIEAPQDVPEQYWDGRWIQIQPGLAIDVMGNPIVIPEPMDFRISSTPAAQQAITVYVVIRYVDPDLLQGQGTSDTVRETFRIDEKNSLPTVAEVELCRLVLQAGGERISSASNVFAPDPNQLDLRYRIQAQARPTASIQVATLNHSESLTDHLACLLQATQGLYPTLQGVGEVGSIQIQTLEEVALYDLLVMTDGEARSLSDTSLDILHQFQAMGGVVLIESTIHGTQLEKLMSIRLQLRNEIAALQNQDLLQEHTNTNDLMSLKTPLESELKSIQAALQTETEAFAQAFKPMLRSLEASFESWETLPHQHPLHTQPFFFAALPSIQQQPIQLIHQGGVIILLGNLSVAWGIDDTLALPRETIRTAQEFGINLLYFAQRRKQLMQLQQGTEASH